MKYYAVYRDSKIIKVIPRTDVELSVTPGGYGVNPFGNGIIGLSPCRHDAEQLEQFGLNMPDDATAF